MHPKERGQQVKGSDSPPLLCPCETPLAVLGTFWVPSICEGYKTVGTNPEEARKLRRGPENLPCENRLERRGFGLETKRLCGDLTAPSSIQGVTGMPEGGFFIRNCGDRTRSYGLD